MNLEHVEELCLQYLRQSVNPLTPLRTLLEHCKRDPQCAGLSEKDLLSFLHAHALIDVVDGPLDTDPVTAAAFVEAGFDMGPRAILKTRVPSVEDMAALLDEQIAAMTRVLSEALSAAGKQGDAANAGKIQDALRRSEALRIKMRELMPPRQKGEDGYSGSQ